VYSNTNEIYLLGKQYITIKYDNLACQTSYMDIKLVITFDILAWTIFRLCPSLSSVVKGFKFFFLLCLLMSKHISGKYIVHL
jgi:hypothetical protein